MIDNIELTCKYADIKTDSYNSIFMKLSIIDENFIASLKPEEIVRNLEPAELIEAIAEIYGRDFIHNLLTNMEY